MTLRENMQAWREQHPGLRAAELAAGFMARVLKRDLLDLVTDEFWRLDRTETRAFEVEAAARMASGPMRERAVSSVGECDDPLAPVRALLDRRYKWMTGEERALRYMTKQEHEERIQMQLSKRNGIDRSIAMHRWALEELERTGANCLDDLDKPKAQVA